MDDNLSIIEEEMEQLSVTTGEIIGQDWLVIIYPAECRQQQIYGL